MGAFLDIFYVSRGASKSRRPYIPRDINLAGPKRTPMRRVLTLQQPWRGVWERREIRAARAAPSAARRGLGSAPRVGRGQTARVRRPLSRGFTTGSHDEARATSRAKLKVLLGVSQRRRGLIIEAARRPELHSSTSAPSKTIE